MANRKYILEYDSKADAAYRKTGRYFIITVIFTSKIKKYL
jgi:hypothetical protein